MTPEQAYEITRKAVQYVMIAKTVKPETEVFGTSSDLDSLNMVDAIVAIERDVEKQTGKRIMISVGDMGTVTVADLAAHVYALLQE
jgi:acyl carrier protein